MKKFCVLLSFLIVCILCSACGPQVPPTTVNRVKSVRTVCSKAWGELLISGNKGVSIFSKDGVLDSLEIQESYSSFGDEKANDYLKYYKSIVQDDYKEYDDLEYIEYDVSDSMCSMNSPDVLVFCGLTINVRVDFNAMNYQDIEKIKEVHLLEKNSFDLVSAINYFESQGMECHTIK